MKKKVYIKIYNKQNLFFNITTSACVCICLQALHSTPSFLHKTRPKPFGVTGLIRTIFLNIRMINGCFYSNFSYFIQKDIEMGFEIAAHLRRADGWSSQ